MWSYLRRRREGKKVADPTKPEKHLCGLEKQQPEAGLTQAAELEHTCFLTNKSPRAAARLLFVANGGLTFTHPGQKTQGGRLPSRLDCDLIGNTRKEKKNKTTNSQLHSSGIQTPLRLQEINIQRVHKQQQHDRLRPRALAAVSQKANRFVRTALAGLDDLPKAFARGRQDIRHAVRRADKHSC